MIHPGCDGKPQFRFRFPAILDGVQGIRARAVEPKKPGRELPVDGKARAIAGHGPERTLVETLTPSLKTAGIPEKRLGKGKKNVTQSGHLGGLMVGIPRHEGVPVLMGLVNKDFDERKDLGAKYKRAIPEVEAHVQGDLVVAAAGRVEPPPDLHPILIDQPTLHVAVDIFPGWVEPEFPFLEGFSNGPQAGARIPSFLFE